MQVVPIGGQIFVDWAHFAGRQPTEAFFHNSIRRAINRPFNRVFRYRMSLGDLFEQGLQELLPVPNGFIFHMSRCGSTLVSQMLAAHPNHTVISEASPIDEIVRTRRADDRGAD